MDAIEHFSEKRNLARVRAGMSGGPFNKIPAVDRRTFIDGYPAEINQMFQHVPIKAGTPIDVWNERRANGA